MKVRPIFWIALLLLGLFVIVAVSLVDVIPPVSQTYGAMLACKSQIQQYAIAHNRLPTSLEETTENAGDKHWLKDGWSNEIIYTVDAKGVVTLKSFGRDAQPGGTGDNDDMIGTYPSRQPDGKWSDEDVDWIKGSFPQFQ